MVPMGILEHTRVVAQLGAEVVIVVSPFAENVEAVDLMLAINLSKICIVAKAYRGVNYMNGWQLKL